MGSWRSFFNLGKSSSMSKRKLQRNPSEPNELKAMALAGESRLQHSLQTPETGVTPSYFRPGVGKLRPEGIF